MKYVVYVLKEAVVEAEHPEHAKSVYYAGDEIIAEESVENVVLLSESISPLKELICE